MVSQNLRLIWQDEFTENGKPDPEKWNYETGFVRNLEEQIYTQKLRNVRVRDGYLEIIARKEKVRNQQYDPGIQNYRYNTPFANYTSGSLNTKSKFEFQYGRIDVRAKLPSGKGVWPAIWMLGANFDEVDYPRAGEIDIMEQVGKTQNTIYGTVHYSEKNGIKSKGSEIEIPQVSDDFHIFSLNWNFDKLEWLVDDQVYHEFNINEAGKENPFRKPFFLLINLALGGKWAGEIDNQSLPQTFKIDYIRVYQREE